MLRTEGDERTEGRTIRLVCVVMLSLQRAIRPGQSADLAAVSALLIGAGLPTDELTSASDLHLWVLQAEGNVVDVDDLLLAVGEELFGVRFMRNLRLLYSPPT